MANVKRTNIPAPQHCVNKEYPYIGSAEDIHDDVLGKTQGEFNSETKEFTDEIYDKDYNAELYSGLGRKYLRKNMVNGVNVLTQAMINEPNTYYIIQYDYNLNGAEITIPANCVLRFEGGSLDNGVIIGNKTKIDAPSYKIFGDNLTLFKYGYIAYGYATLHYTENYLYPLDYIITDGVMDINKVVPEIPSINPIITYGKKIVCSGYERGSNIDGLGTLENFGNSLDVRTDLVLCDKKQLVFNNNTAKYQGATLNGTRFLTFNGDDGNFTIPYTTHCLFVNSNDEVLEPGTTVSQSDVYMYYLAKFVPLVQMSTFYGSAKLSWFIGDDFVNNEKHVQEAPDVTLNFQKAMLCPMDIECDIEGFVRVEDSIYLETPKKINFGNEVGRNSGIQQYISTNNIRSDYNYRPTFTLYTLNTNKPLIYIRNSAVNINGGTITANFANTHNTTVCVFDLDCPISGVWIKDTRFVGKTNNDGTLMSRAGIEYYINGRDNVYGYCYFANIDAYISNCQYGLYIPSSGANSNYIKLHIWGYYCAIYARMSASNIDFIAQSTKCIPTDIAKELPIGDIVINGGNVDGFFWDLSTSSQSGNIVMPYGKAKVGGKVSLIGKSTHNNFYQWDIRSTTLVFKDSMYDVPSIPSQSGYPFRNCVYSLSNLIDGTNINTNSSSKAYLITDNFTTNYSETSGIETFDFGFYHGPNKIFSVNRNFGELKSGTRVLNDDEYCEIVITPKDTGYFFRSNFRLNSLTVYGGNFNHVQVILKDGNNYRSSIIDKTDKHSADVTLSNYLDTKLDKVIVRVWGGNGGTNIPKVLLWDNNIDNNLKILGINQNFDLYNNGKVRNFIGTFLVGNGILGQLEITSESELSTLLGNLKTNSAQSCFISVRDSGKIWQYKSYNKKLYNLDGTEAIFNFIGNSSNRPSTTLNGTTLSTGTRYYDTTLKKQIWWDGSKWIEYDGAKAGVKRSGTFNEKPASTDIYVGYQYFCTDKQTTEGATNGIMIYHKGSNVWVDALGRVIS